MRLYPDFLYQLYNIFFTAIPIIVFGVFDNDIPRSKCTAFPELYTLGPKRHYLNVRTILHWTFTGVVHALLVFMIPFLTLAGTGIDYEHGRATDIWVIGNTVLFISITVVNGKLILLSSSLNWVSLLGFSFSLVTYVILCPIFNLKMCLTFPSLSFPFLTFAFL